jgi:hypothetical protein
MLLTFDIDGVIAAVEECDHDKSLRTWTNYRNKQPHPTLDLKILNRLINTYHTYFVSARSFEGASDGAKQWLREIGVEVDKSLGVICTEGVGFMWDRGECEYEAASMYKPTLLRWLGSTVHIDDHPKIIEGLYAPTVGILFNNDMSWAEIESIVKRVWTDKLNERTL